MSSWQHKCTVNTPKRTEKLNPWQAAKKRVADCVTISPHNPYGMAQFRSIVEIERERKRQLATGRFVIHPFSKFREWYELFAFYLYILALIMKPLEFGFTKHSHFVGFLHYGTFSVAVDALCWIDIFVNFFTGYVNHFHRVELDRGMICRHYAYSSFFVCDVLSSFPKKLIYYFLPRTPFALRVTGLMNVLYMLKIIRLISVVGSIDTSAKLYNSKRGPVFLQQSTMVLLALAHWLTCFQFGVPRFMRMYMLQSQQNETWFSRIGIQNEPMYRQYFHSLFKTTAYILGTRLTKIYDEKLPEEFIMAAVTYAVGKVVVALLWIVFAVAILNSRSVEIKFAEVMNQLNEYLTQKQLPLNLRERIFNYYMFKYQKKYLNEEITTSYLSNNLKKDVNLHMCNSLIRSVSLFSSLNAEELASVIHFLVPEIFLPNDTIIQSGSLGDAIYFISSGTVAVYTRSGKEVCHLQDGSYFGEISLIIRGQTRVATVVAIEITQVYRLDRKNFDKCLLNNRKVCEKLSRYARNRLKLITGMDDEYKKKLFEQSMQEIVPPHVDN